MDKGTHFSVFLNGEEQSFPLTELSHTHVQDITSFTQRGGFGTLTSLDSIAEMEQRSFHGGVGQTEMKEPSAYRIADNLDPRTPGMLTLMGYKDREAFATEMIDIDACTAVIDGTRVIVVISKGTSAGNSYIYAYDGTTFYNLLDATITSKQIISCFFNGYEVVVGTLGDNLYGLKGDLTTPTWTAVSAATLGNGMPRDAEAWCIHDGYVWYAQTTAQSNLIHYGRQIDYTDLEGDIDDNTDVDHPLASTVGDAAAVQVGPVSDHPVKRLISFDRRLWAFRTDGIWVIDRLYEGTEQDFYKATKMFDYSEQDYSDNFEAVVVWNGALWFDVHHHIFRYSGGTLIPLDIPGYDFEYPQSRDYQVRALLPSDTCMYAIVDNALYSTDGSGWHKLYQGVNGTLSSVAVDATARLLHFQDDSDDYHLALVIGNNLTGQSSITLIHNQEPQFPSPYEAEGYLITSRFDGGYVNIDKYWQSVGVYYHVPENDSYISVDAYVYRNEDVYLYHLGDITTNNSGESLDIDGETIFLRSFLTFEFPIEALGKSIELRFTLHVDPIQQDETPILYGYNIEYVPRPKTVYAYNTRLIIRDNQLTRDNRRYDKSAREVLQLLRTARDQRTPMLYQDFMGHADYVFCSAYRAQPIDYEVQLASGENVEYGEGFDVNVTFMSVARDVCIPVYYPDGTTLHGRWVVPCRAILEGTLELAT